MIVIRKFHVCLFYITTASRGGMGQGPPPYVPPQSQWYAAPPPAYAPPPQGRIFNFSNKMLKIYIFQNSSYLF